MLIIRILKIIFNFLAVLGLCCCARAFSSCAEWGSSLVEVHGLLIVVASLVAEHGLWAHWLQKQQLAGSGVGPTVVARGLCCSTACGIFLDQGLIHVPCIGRWLLILCTIKEVLCNIHFCIF